MIGTLLRIAAAVIAAAAPVNRPSPLVTGVTTQALASNSTIPWRARDLAQVLAFERLVHAHAGVVMWYADWRTAVNPAQLRSVAARRSTPEITWEPWNATGGVRQPAYTLASIIGGRHDAYIRSWALALKAYRKPVLLRFAQEMNGSWYPWDETVNGNRRGQFAAAWRHVHNIFTKVGTSNVKWVWSPIARGNFPLSTREWPGAAYVDIVGLSGFNAGRALPQSWGGWRSFARVFGSSLATLARLAPRTPVEITEVSTVAVGGSEPGWIKNMFRYLASRPSIRWLVWFDVLKQTDWRITSPQAGRAFAAGLAQVRRARRAGTA